MAVFFDSHTHLMDEMYDGKWQEVLSRAREAGVTYVTNVGYNKETSKQAVAIAQEAENMGIPGVYATVGLHPENIEELDDDFAFVYELARIQKVVAIGEVGLDYHYEASASKAPMEYESVRRKQKEIFVRQIAIANELGLPVTIHSRDADMDMLSILKEYPIENGFVMHCFSSSLEVMKECLKLGAYISLAGPVTFRNARGLLDVAKSVPEDRLLIETDAPYLSPEPYRGKRNETAFVVYTAQKIADIRECSLAKLAEMTTANAKRFYRV